MPVAVMPAPVPVGAPASAFYARVKSVHCGLLSDRVKCLFLEVLSGSISRGDPIELLRPDGTTTMVAGRRIREALGDTVLDLEEPHPPKREVGEATVARTPGLQAPPLPVDHGAGLDRLLEAVRNARRHDFPVEWAVPVKPVSVWTPERLVGFLRELPDQAVALLIERRIRDATGHHDNPFAIMPAAEEAAMHLDAIGLQEDGDRLLLLVAAAVQGHKAGVAVRAVASVGAMALLSSENATGQALKLGRGISMAMGIEMGDAFARSFQSGIAVAGEVVETALLEADRAVGVGWCKSCHDVVQLKLGKSAITASRELRCPNDNHKADDPAIVVPADVPAALAALRNLKR